MNPKAWHTNALARIAESAERLNLNDADVRTLHQFANRLTIDPFDLRADRDNTGEMYCRIAQSATYTAHDLAVGYRIDMAHRTVEVISFALVPSR